MSSFTHDEAMMLMSTSQFRSFNEMDWMTFAGANSSHPLICYTDNMILIVDAVDGQAHLHIFEDNDDVFTEPQHFDIGGAA